MQITLFDMSRETVLYHSRFKDLGQPNALHEYTIYLSGKPLDFIEKIPNRDIESAISLMLDNLMEYDLVDIACVTHHIMHGGKYIHPTILSEHVIHYLHEMSYLASENPPSIIAAMTMQKLMPHAKHIAVFDTAYHQTIDPIHQKYAISADFSTHGEIKKYGFYGVTHYYVSKIVRRMLKEKDADRYAATQRVLHIHLNSSVSICAIKDGRSVNTSMGFTSIAGPIMPTKSGDIDPGLVCYLFKKYKKTPDQMLSILSKRSGLFALTDQSDVSSIYRRSLEGSIECEQAIEKLVCDVARSASSFLPDLGGVDAVVFSGSMLEAVPILVEKIAHRLSYLGVAIKTDYLGGITRSDQSDLTGEGSQINVFFVKSREQLEVARQAKGLLSRTIEAMHQVQ